MKELKKSIERIWGNFLKILANVIGFIFDFLIAIVEVLVNLTETARRAISVFLSFGCFFIIISPFFTALYLLNPWVWLLLALIIIIPFLGPKAVSALKYVRYMIVEYLTDYSEHLIIGKERTFDTISGYGQKYKRDEREKKRREEEARQERQRRQNEEWNRIFEEWYRRNTGGGYGRGSYGGGYGGSYSGGTTYQDPTSTFNKEYEDACKTLNVSPDADKYEIKLAYRKMAKKYHPDINKEPGATEKFQEVNNAYEFLSDENIDRYKKINNK